MDERDFVFWLRGALELGGLKTLDESQVQMISRHLDLVMTPVTSDTLGPEVVRCRGCGEPLTSERHTLADGCDCNADRGVNHGLVPVEVCTCVECDPAQTGGSRVRGLNAIPTPPSIEERIRTLTALDRNRERLTGRCPTHRRYC